MTYRRRPTKTGRPAPRRGVKLPPERKFEPKLDTQAGVKVRSTYEQQCADFFYSHDITFQYEPLMLLGGRQFRPDFFLPDYDLFVEICGYGHMPHYRDHIKQKRQLYDKHGLRALFVEYSGRGSLVTLLRAALEEAGVSFASSRRDLRRG